MKIKFKYKLLSAIALIGLVFLGATSCDAQEETIQNAVKITGQKSLYVGETLQLTAIFSYTEVDVTFSSSDLTVAEVSKEGLVTAISAGSATITVIADDDVSIVDSVTIAVYEKVEEPVPEYVTATFVNYDNSVLYEDTVAYGGTPTYVGDTPTRPTGSAVYTFVGWDKEVGPIYEDTTFVAQFDEYSLKDFTFTVNAETKGYTLASYNGTDKDVVIPSEYNFKTVTDIGSNAFANNTTMETVSIPDSIVSVGDYAFSGCSSLEAVVLPTNLTSLGIGVFQNCTSLVSASLPFRPTEIPSYTFYNNINLERISYVNEIEIIGDYAFYNCSSFDYDMVFGPSDISVRSIGVSAFEGAISLSDLSLPMSLVSLGAGAFANNTSVEIVRIGEMLQDIDTSGTSFVSGCSNLRQIIVNPYNEYYSSTDNGWLYNKEQTELLLIPPASTDLTLSDNLQTIASGAFNGISGDYMEIPKSVKSVGSYAFQNANITEVVFEEPDQGDDEAVEFSTYAFYESNVVSLELSSAVKTIPNYFAQYSSKLEEVVIKEGTTSIGNYAFSSCTALDDVTLPEGLLSIGLWGFRYDEKLTEIALPSTLTSLGNYTFAATGLTSITIPSSLSSLGTYLFSNCANLSSVTFDSGSLSYTSLGNYMFYSCTNLTYIKLPEGLTTTGTQAFRYSGLVEVDLPTTLTTISALSFANCEDLRTFTFGPGEANSSDTWSLSSVVSTAFNNTTGVTTINFRGTETQFNNLSSFSGLSNLLNNGATVNYEYEFTNPSAGSLSLNSIKDVDLEGISN